MIGFNHAAVGGLLAQVLPLPLAIPAALASHFVLDTLPHYGIPHHKRDNSSFWRIFTTVDFFFAWTFLSFIALSRHHYAVFFCGVLAASPDFIWVVKVVRHHTFHLRHHNSKFEQWHIAIQKYERAWGLLIELPLALALGYLVVRYW